MKKIFLILIALLLLYGCEKEKQEDVLRPVKYIKVRATDFESKKSFSGLVVSQISTNLSFRVEGNIIEQYVKEGDFVKKGQALAKIDPTLYKLEVGENEAKAQKTKIDAQNAQNYLKRLGELYKEGAISARQYDDARANSAALNAQLKADRERSAYSAKKMSYTLLKAPLDGYITKEISQIGSYVYAGESVFEFISAKKPEVKTYIPQKFINDVHMGQSATITIDALENRSFKGLVANVNPSSLDTVAFSIKVDILEPSNDIKNGMSAIVSLDLKKPDIARPINIPVNTIREDDGGNFVWTLEAKEGNTATVKKTRVKTGRLKDGTVDILSGLKDGDMVVSAGVDFIQEGQKVKINESG